MYKPALDVSAFMCVFDIEISRFTEDLCREDVRSFSTYSRYVCWTCVNVS